jgi:hypothetical protein
MNFSEYVKKSFRGLSREYYLRQLFFSSLILVVFLYALIGSDRIHYDFMMFSVINTLLYPYARFVYESCVRFILGENIIILPLRLHLIGKLFTILMCWWCAPFISPVGLVYLAMRKDEDVLKLSVSIKRQ